jgi:phosphatidylglycerol:prolipoprotein diacylglycerol transferase
MDLAVITIHLDPEIHLGPLTIAWHGLTIAVGLVAGGWLTIVVGRERGLDELKLLDLVMLIAISGIAGARIFYLIENDPGALIRPADWLGTRGFSFYGGIIFGVPAVALYLRRRGLGISYLDALAAGFPLGMALGRIGDVINGEHYGPVSELPWAVRNANPAADTPDPSLAYQSGGLYEVVLALAIFTLIWPLRKRFERPGTLLWTVIALYAGGRFLMFFVRDDSTQVALSLSYTQWTSLGLLVIAVVGLIVARRSRMARPATA